MNRLFRLFICLGFIFGSLPALNAMADQRLDFDTMKGIGADDRGEAATGTAANQPSGSAAPMPAADIFKTADPAVVTIILRITDQDIAHGSGFLVRENGYILTNNHVVDLSPFGEYAPMITCRAVLSDERSFEVKIIKTDPDLDLALLKIKGSNLPFLPIGTAGKLQVGEPVYVIGTPVRLEFSHSLTTGIVSGLERDKGRIQTSAILHGGNSGGPALNDRGEVIGVAVAVAMGGENQILTIGQKQVEVPTINQKAGISFLVPINYAINLLSLTY